MRFVLVKGPVAMLLHLALQFVLPSGSSWVGNASVGLIKECLPASSHQKHDRIQTGPLDTYVSALARR